MTFFDHSKKTCPYKKLSEGAHVFSFISITLISIPRLRFLERTMKETMGYCLKTKEILSIIEPQSQFE